MKAYIAAPIFTPAEINVAEQMKQVCKSFGLEVFSPYDASREIWNGRKPADCSEEERRTVLRNNIENLADTDVLVAHINRDSGGYEGRPDTGVVWEMGYYKAKQRNFNSRVTIAYIHPYFALPDKGINLMLTGTVDAVVTNLSHLRMAVEMACTDDLSTMRAIYDPQRANLQEQETMKP